MSLPFSFFLFLFLFWLIQENKGEQLWHLKVKWSLLFSPHINDTKGPINWLQEIHFGMCMHVCVCMWVHVCVCLCMWVCVCVHMHACGVPVHMQARRHSECSFSGAVHFFWIRVSNQLWICRFGYADWPRSPGSFLNLFPNTGIAEQAAGLGSGGQSSAPHSWKASILPILSCHPCPMKSSFYLWNFLEISME